MTKSPTRRNDTHQPKAPVDLYGAAYGGFATQLYAEIRTEAFGEDIGQTSWLSAKEQDLFIPWLALHKHSRLLDVACGSGGPALRIAERSGCTVYGVDVPIAAAQDQARKRGVTDRASFTVADASKALQYAAGSFDAVVCIDAINHFPDRSAVLVEWSRLLRVGGSAVFTDPIVVTGPLSNREIAVRSSIGFFLFAPPGIDERAIKAAGLTLQHVEDRTENMANLAAQWLAAREARRVELVKIEGEESVDHQAEFLSVAAKLASERRLSRFLFHATKP